MTLAPSRYRTGDEEYASVREPDLAPLLAGNYRVLAQFSKTETVLLRHT